MNRPSIQIDVRSDAPDRERAGESHDVRAEAPERNPSSRLRRRRRAGGALLLLLFGAGGLLALELRTSWLQSLILADYVEEITFSVEDGPSPVIRFPASGPYDVRLGYTRIPDLVERLRAGGFEISSQARLSERLVQLVDRGIFPIYWEKSRAGLWITDRHGHPVFVAEYPDRTFSDFEEIPPVLVRTLLYIENRALLDPDLPYRNPAVEWDRVARAAVDLGLRKLGSDRSVPGASTLATQIEKFRHSPRGITNAPDEKLRQITSASLRSYLDGRNTLRAQRRIVLDYLNSVPLAGMAGYGEINGLRTGIRAWYGMEPDIVMDRLRDAEAERPPDGSRGRLARGRAYRAVLSLLLAQSRPTYYLATPEGRERLVGRTEDYLERLTREGVVPDDLARAAASVEPRLRLRAPVEAPVSFVDRKGANVLRTHLLGLLQEDRLYELDRWDLTVESTLDEPVQAAITEELRRLGDPAHAASAGLTGPRLLSDTGSGNVVYTFLLLEATDRGNLVRVQTDSHEGPLDLNEGGKLELGSTAKLRTLVTYLEMVEELHRELAGREPTARDSVAAMYDDPLTLWARSWLRANPEGDLSEMLAAALARRYSVSPRERFFTGGGIHTFSNFDATLDSSAVSVSTAFRHSVNLVFVRLMRDLVRYESLRVPGSTARVLEADSDEAVRREYLSRFADREGRIFVSRFYRQLYGAGGEPNAMIDRVIGGRTMTPLRVARVYRAIRPEATADSLASFLRDRRDEAPGDDVVRELFRRSSPEGVSWADLGYLSATHPLELWVARYLVAHPGAPLSDVVAEGASVRQDIYRWLFDTRRRSAQDQRIGTIVEVEAFEELSRRWQRLGYPFRQLVPSYATAIGSSGDRPTALAELVGILLNDGVRRPWGRVEELRFGAETPYETTLRRNPGDGGRVVSAEVARAARSALVDVVESGTGRRAFGALTSQDGSPLPIGGKTGTGDNRFVTVDARGNVVESRIVNRTSTFVFFLDDRFFGVVTALVQGTEAADHRFTSALPTQILRHLSPHLESLVSG